MRDSSPMTSSETSPDTRRRSSDAKQRKNGMVIIRHKSLCLARDAIRHKTDALGDLRHIRNDLLHHHFTARQSLLATTGTLYTTGQPSFPQFESDHRRASDGRPHDPSQPPE